MSCHIYQYRYVRYVYPILAWEMGVTWPATSSSASCALTSDSWQHHRLSVLAAWEAKSKSKRSPSEWTDAYSIILHLTASSSLASSNVIQCHPTQSHGWQIIRNSSHGCHHQSLRWILAAPLLRCSSCVAGPRSPGTPRHWAGLPWEGDQGETCTVKLIYEKDICFTKKNMWSLHPMILTHKYHKSSFMSFTMWKYLDAHGSCWISFPEAFRKRLKTMRIRWTVASVWVHPKSIFATVMCSSNTPVFGPLAWQKKFRSTPLADSVGILMLFCHDFSLSTSDHGWLGPHPWGQLCRSMYSESGRFLRSWCFPSKQCSRGHHSPMRPGRSCRLGRPYFASSRPLRVGKWEIEVKIRSTSTASSENFLGDLQHLSLFA